VNRHRCLCVCDSITNVNESCALSILGSLLVDGEKSAFYQSLVESGIGSDYAPVTGFVELQCFTRWVFREWVIEYISQYRFLLHFWLAVLFLEKYFTCSSLKELFENVEATTITNFIKEIIFLSSCIMFVFSFPFYISYRSLVFTERFLIVIYIMLFIS